MLSLLVLTGGCASAKPKPTQAYLQVVTEPADARIRVDDAYAGTGRVLARHPKMLAPGVHYLSIEASGYFPHDLELNLEPGLSVVRAKLRPLVP